MPVRFRFTILFLVAVFISCSEIASNQVDAESVEEDQTSEEEMPITFSDDPLDFSDVPEGWIELKFTDLSFLIEDMDFDWKDKDGFEDRSCEVDKEAYFYLFPGDWMFNTDIQIMDSEFDEIEIYVQEMVQLSITTQRMMEVPFCLIDNWKSEKSEWVKIEQRGNQLNFGSSPDFKTDPIKYDLEEVKMAVRESCGEEWYQDIVEIDNITDLPCSEFTSQYSYKIIARNSETGKSIERLIVFYTPTSC